MLKTWQFRALSAIAAIALALAFTNVLLFSSNRAEQTKLAARQQFIQQSVQLEPLYQQIVRALAELSAKNNDAQLKSILSSQGITFSVAPSEAPDSGSHK